MREKIGVIAVAAKPIGPALGPASRPGPAGFVPFAVGGPIAGVAFLVTAARGRRAPRINDFTTDLADPPAFVPTSVGPLSSTVRCVRGAYANAPHRSPSDGAAASRGASETERRGAPVATGTIWAGWTSWASRRSSGERPTARRRGATRLAH